MMPLSPLTDLVTPFRINARVVKTNKPDAIAPAIGNPTSDISLKISILLCPLYFVDPTVI
jgi:hypothetical protein